MIKALGNWVKRHPKKSQRILEICPGLFSWSLILFPVWGSFLIPELVAYYIIGFAVYWLYKSVTVAVLATVGHFKIRASERYDWMGDVSVFPDWQRVHHIIILPTYKEPLATLERTLKQLSQQTYPKEKIHLMMSFEEREGREAREKGEKLRKLFERKFGDFWVTYHPDLPGEVKGKSANTSWAAKIAKKKLIDEQKKNIDYVTITSQDADAVLHPNYLASLTYQFLDHPNRYKRIWQAAVVFYNNIWQVPAPIRVLATIWSVVQVYILMRRDRLINFSTYSTSLRMVDEIGYWDTNVIPEDYRLFFKSFFHFKGRVEVEPIYLPVFEDAAESTNLLKTLINQYEQVKRWAWGVSDDPYIIKNWLMVEGVPFWEKTIRVLNVLEDHLLWPVNWFAITLGALLPPLLNEKFSRTVLGKSLPQVASAILTLSLVSLVAVIFIDAQRRPPRPKSYPRLRRWLQPLEFLLLPVVGFFFNALPGVDAHTRLMLGRYIEYRVTEKVEPKEEIDPSASGSSHSPDGSG